MPKIQKELSGDEKTILSNIQSLLNEILQMNMGESMGMEEETPIMEEMSEDKVMRAEEEEDEEVKKGIETTQSNSSTASDDAEERISETQTELTEESVQEVAKALLGLQKKKQVKKSANEQLLEAVESLTKIQKSNQQEMQEMQTAFSHMLDGLGISKQYEIAQKSHADKRVNKSITNENEQLLNFIKKSLGQDKKESNDYMSNSQRVKKNLADANVLNGMLGKRVIK
jgi:hypothetical protein